MGMFLLSRGAKSLGSFLDIIERGYLKCSEAVIANSEACEKLIKPGVHPVGPELDALQREAIGLNTELHLQIESYYLFAKGGFPAG